MSFETTRFSNLRENVSQELASLPDRHLAEALAARNIDAEAMEGFFGDLGRFASRAAPAILPVAGRIVGGVFGGPAGSAIGGQLGSLAGGAITSATGGARRGAPPRPRPPMRTPAPIIAPIIAPGVAPPMAPPVAPLTIAMPPTVGGSDPITPAEPIDPGAGSPAASQLLQTITRPETLAALASMALGSSGRSDLPIGGTSVPVSAFSNLISVLAGRAEAEYGESIARIESALPEYMRGESGEARGDPAIEEHRAGALFEFLNEHESYGDSGDSGDSEWSEWAEWENESSEYSESFESVESSESSADSAELVELAYELSESEYE